MSALIGRLRSALARTIEEQRLRVSGPEALPQLAVLGIVCGLLAALVMIAFRVVIESGQTFLLPAPGVENFEELPAGWRFIFAMAGGLGVAAILRAVPEAARHTGVVHVLERLAYHQGRLPARNGLVQFAAAAVAIVAGLSVGREGPAIHLGAATASAAGQRLGLPHNGLRVLVGCGVAGAIAASFNTPLAGVAFAMEVVLMEYTVVGFAPVILAAVSATALTHVVYGGAPAFEVPPLTLRSLAELPWILAMGLAIGLLSAALIALVDTVTRRTRNLDLWVRGAAAGAVGGFLALFVPQIMGIGYDTIGAALVGSVPVAVLVAVVVFKLVATGVIIGLGIPGGLIGPMLVIGATAGGAIGILGATLVSAQVSSTGFYALVGLGAMMAGTLHAPLAALTAMLELTGNPNIIWPGMLACIAAYGMSRVVFRQQPVFVTLMRARGLDYRNDPVVQSLRGLGVAAVMDTKVATLPRMAGRRAIEAALARAPTWVVVMDEGVPAAALSAMDLARQSLHDASVAGESGTAASPAVDEVDLLEVPADRLQLAPVAVQATLQEALDALDASGAEALYVRRSRVPEGEGAFGVLTRVEIERRYRYGR